MQKETPLKDQFHAIFGRYGATRLFARHDFAFDEMEAFTGEETSMIITRSRRDGIFRLYDEETRDIRLFRASTFSRDVSFDDMDGLFELLLWRLKEQDALPFGADLYVVGGNGDRVISGHFNSRNKRRDSSAPFVSFVSFP